MAKVLNYESEIQAGSIIEPWHISQSVDAFTGTEAYDITISGSLTLKGEDEIVKIISDSEGGNPTISFYQLDERRSRIQHNNEGDALTLISENPSGDVSRLEFYTKTQSDIDPSMKMRITDDGRFLLNTSAIPTTTRFEIDNDSSNTNLTFTKGGNFGLGTYNPTSKLHVVGSGRFSSNLTVSNITSTTKLIAGPGHSGFWNKDNVNILGSNITADAANYTYVNNLNISGSLKDSSGDTGTSGQILSSTGTGLNWINNTDLGDYSPYITGSTSTGILPTATSANNCTTIGNNSTIAGGTLNTGSGDCSFIGGGESNSISGYCHQAIVGGCKNSIISSPTSTIAGGKNNSLSTAYQGDNFIGGGNNNCIDNNSCSSIIGSGNDNRISTDCDFYYNGILGGHNNLIAGTKESTFIIGSNITASTSCTTYVNNLDISGSLKDSSGDTGTSGQILSSTGTGLNWINNTDLGDYSPYITGSTSTGILPTATSANNCTTIGNNSTIAGGTLNTASEGCVFIGGGQSNSISGGYGNHGVIVGGNNNTLSDSYCGFIGGGSNNCLAGSNTGQVIVGGDNNTVVGADAGILGGRNNCVDGHESSFIIGTNLTSSANFTTYVNNLDVEGSLVVNLKATIGDGHTHTGTLSTIAGGFLNTLSGGYGFIGGGYTNCVTTSNSSTVSGQYNTISGTYGEDSFIGGGCCNNISSNRSAIVGGNNNTISSDYQTNNFIGGGNNNCIGFGAEGVIVGGLNNTINPGQGNDYNGILGGNGNCIGNGIANTFIIGSQITASASCTTYVNNIHVTGSTTANAILQLSRRETTPTGTEGMIIASGSAGASKLYYHDGSEWNALF